MTRKLRLRFAFLPIGIAALALPFGCSTLANNNPINTVCCSDFKPGTDMANVDWGLSGSQELEFAATMQAIGDFSGQAQAMVTDLGVSCKGLAVDLGVDENTVTDTDPNQFAIKWCSQAGTALGALKGQLTINVQPAKCDINISAKADCEGKCSAQAKCTYTPAEIKLGCTSGQLSGKCTAMCTGDCEGSANLAVTCQGQCLGECQGTCSSGQMGNSCAGTCTGKCRGTCKADVNAMGTCEGTCSGTCSVDFVAPKCDGTFTPPMGSCMASANCEASCQASATAQAECSPPSIDVEGATNLGDKIAAVEKWLPQILLDVQGRLTNLQADVKAITDVGGSFKDNLSGTSTADFCIVPAVAAVATAGDNITATVQAGASITAAF